MTTPSVFRCSTGHYFVGATCPHCSSPPVETVPAFVGDCVACGELCPAGIYCCGSPSPLTASLLHVDRTIPQPRNDNVPYTRSHK
jgi:hypothetical protein